MLSEERGCRGCRGREWIQGDAGRDLELGGWIIYGSSLNACFRLRRFVLTPSGAETCVFCKSTFEFGTTGIFFEPSFFRDFVMKIGSEYWSGSEPKVSAIGQECLCHQPIHDLFPP